MGDSGPVENLLNACGRPVSNTNSYSSRFTRNEQFMSAPDEGIWYPSVADVISIHEDIVDEYPDTSSGVRDRGAIEFAIDAARGEVGTDPESIHERAYHLLRLLAANHPFVDANKRTALDVTATFYLFNGYEFDYDHGIRDVLAAFATDEPSVDSDSVRAYLRAHTRPVNLDAIVDPWREELVEHGLHRLDDLWETDEG